MIAANIQRRSRLTPLVPLPVLCVFIMAATEMILQKICALLTALHWNRIKVAFILAFAWYAMQILVWAAYQVRECSIPIVRKGQITDCIFPARRKYEGYC